MRVFIDSNIPMYVAGAEHPHRAPAHRLLERVQSREIEAVTSTEVLQEILYRYSHLGRLDLARQVYELTIQLCSAVFEISLADTDRAVELLTGVSGLTARDALHAAVMSNHELEWIATFDTDFDRVPGVRRLELS